MHWTVHLSFWNSSYEHICLLLSTVVIFMFAWEERNFEEKCTNRLPDQLCKHTVKEYDVLVQRCRIWWNHCSPNSKYIPLTLSTSLRFLWHRYLIFYVRHDEDRILPLTNYKPMDYNCKREVKRKKIYKYSFGSFSHILSLFNTKAYWHALENLATLDFTNKWRGGKIIELKNVCSYLKYTLGRKKKKQKQKQPCRI